MAFAASSLAAQVMTTMALDCAATPMRDSASTATARMEIDAQYGKLADAVRRKDVDALVAMYTPDFHAVMTTGEVWTRERSLAYQRNGLAQVRQTHYVSNTIVGFIACSDTATATVLQ